MTETHKDAKAQAKAAKAYAKATRPWFKKKRFWALGLLVLLVIASQLGSDKNESKPTTSTADTKAATAEKPAAEVKNVEAAKEEAQKAAGLNEKVAYNTYEFTVTGIKCGQASLGSEYFKEKAQGQFCTVGMKVKNTGTKAQSFWADKQKLIDAKGAEYSYSSEGTLAAAAEGTENIWLKEINPGNTLTGQLVFDIPTDAKPTKMHLSDGGLTDQGIDVALS